MGCGCGKKYPQPITTAKSAVSPHMPVPPQVQRATYGAAKTVRSQDTPYRGAKAGTFIRKSV